MSIEHFKDIEREIAELGAVASLVIIESRRIAENVFKQETMFPIVLDVLTPLVAQHINVEKAKEQNRFREQQERVKREIDEYQRRRFGGMQP